MQTALNQRTDPQAKTRLDDVAKTPASERESASSARAQAAELRSVASGGDQVQAKEDPSLQSPAGAQASELRGVVAGKDAPVQAKAGSGEQESGGQTESESGGDKKPAIDYEATLKAMYTSQFGGKLGPLLYDLLKDVVSEKALDGYTKSGVEAGLKELFKLLEESEGDNPDLEAFKSQLQGGWDKLAKDTAAQIIDGMPELDAVFAAVSKWVREHPRAVVTIAVIGAVLAAIAIKVADVDLDIPELGGKFSPTKGVDIGIWADLGKLKDICLESARASLGLHNDQHKFNVEAKVKKGTEEDPEAYSFTIIGKGENTLLEKVEKQNDEHTQALKAEYKTRLHQQWGTTLKLDDWKLKDLDLLYRLSLDFSQKKYESQALDGLKQSDVWSKAQKLFIEYSSKTDVESNEGAHNIKIGLSLVSGKTTETESEGLLTKQTYQQKLDQQFGMTLKLDDWTTKELDLFYRASLSLSQKDFSAKTVDDLKTSTAWEKSLTLFGEISAKSTMDEGNLDLQQLNLKLGVSFLLKRDVTFERSLTDGRKFTTKKNPLEFSIDASASYGYDFMSHQPEARFDVGFKIRF